MADLYGQIIRGDGVGTRTFGGNTKRIFPTSEMGTPKITPVILYTDSQTLPSGESSWTSNDTDVQNYLITSEYQTRGDVFLAVQAVQQFCEVYEVGGSSDSDYLTLMCRDSSIPYDAGTTFQNDGSTITKLQTAVRAALGGALVEVTIGRIVDNDTVG
jgi:hypothetical protein